MRRKYYYAEHAAGYEDLARRGLTQWSDLFEVAVDYDKFPNRPFLERFLHESGIATDARVLEYGCGTGPAACFLAGQGFQVRAIDLVPKAIELAETFAAERGLDVDFAVQDICDLADAPTTEPAALVIDSYCLQSIVTDEDRARVFAAVRRLLEPDGHYLVSTAMYEPGRTYEGDFGYDERSGICLRNGRPHRRHLRPAALRDELTGAGFRVLSQTGPYGGDVVAAI